jgi:hypothetical protein
VLLLYSKTLRISLLQASISGGNANLKTEVAIFVINSHSTMDCESWHLLLREIPVMMYIDSCSHYSLKMVCQDSGGLCDHHI